jgi:hypothetical protein
MGKDSLPGTGLCLQQQLVGWFPSATPLIALREDPMARPDARWGIPDWVA